MSGGADNLAIGVTGHRLQRLAGSDLMLLERRLASLFKAIEASATAQGKIGFALLSNFADGADRIAGRAALGLGWALDALLPFPRDDFARDFENEPDLAAFIAQLAQARSQSHLQPARGPEDDGTAGYERAGREILDRCDLLVAVWDKAPARGRGGAAQIVAEAIDREIPVAVVDPRGPIPIEAVCASSTGTAEILRAAVTRLTST
ncbi:MAG: hypothetical protein V4521_08545 [Pseudomonadota bacterium]